MAGSGSLSALRNEYVAYLRVGCCCCHDDNAGARRLPWKPLRARLNVDYVGGGGDAGLVVRLIAVMVMVSIIAVTVMVVKNIKVAKVTEIISSAKIVLARVVALVKGGNVPR